MKVSIVIPAHNAAATLRECLSACTNQTYGGCEVIVVDDGSTDTTADIARDFPVTLLRQPRRGPAAARNTGARDARGDVIVFTDSDCIPHADWVEQLSKAMRDRVGAAGGTYGIANSGRLLARMIHEEIRSRHIRIGGDADFLGSYNLAVLRDVFSGLGGFDEQFTAASGEDNDLSYRILDAGYTLCFEPAAIVDHYHPAQIGPYLRSQMRHGYWRVKLYAKHPKRAGGDKYAGTVELACASLGILALLALILLPWPSIAVYPLGLAAFIALWRCVLAGHLAIVARDVRLLLAAPILILRDVVRGIGLMCGVWHFLVFRRTST